MFVQGFTPYTFSEVFQGPRAFSVIQQQCLSRQDASRAEPEFMNASHAPKSIDVPLFGGRASEMAALKGWCRE
jgi:hypothetical protein